ncbi:LacI family DNA-binding transcriptional regulator [Glutamicibacter sp. X7]
MSNAPHPRSDSPTRRVTAAMVAAEAGVSTATVSLVVNGKTAGRVSAANEQRVREAIDRLGYVLDSVGSSLARGVSSTIILVAPDISNPFFAQLISGVRQVLASDYHLLLSVSDPGQRPSLTEVSRLFGQRPAGLILHAPDPKFLAGVPAHVPVVAVDAPDAPETVPAVNFDVSQGARLIAEHLHSRGHRTIAYLDAATGTATLRVRREAFMAAATSLGMTVLQHLPVATTIDIAAAGASFTAAWPQMHAAQASAVVCATDTQAYGVLQEARAAGLEVPRDLAVTGFDDLPFSASMNPGLTSINLAADAVGVQAATMLRNLLSDTSIEQSQLIWPSRLVVRGSSAVD